ncbi:MAG TPA: GFA family protein [Caulobacteraceae bacterium]|nr:GFA family protein [Caulobacteraceae bacterium]
MRVTGSCHCGDIRFEAEADLETVGVCHCADCQKLTGSAWRVNVRAPAESFRLTGEPTVYVKTADSGARRAHAFCPRCGTPIYSAAADEPAKAYSLRLGTLSERHHLAPRRQVWKRSALSWSSNLEALPAAAGQG